MIQIPNQLRSTTKVIGYFSYTDNNQVCCDGDACIIAGSNDKMKMYLKRLPNTLGHDYIKKTRFGEIVKGLRSGGAYAFDEEVYERFYQLAQNDGIDGLPENKGFPESTTALHFNRIQMLG